MDQFERRNLVSPPTINFLDARLTRVMHEGAMTGAQFEIRIDGTPRSYRDRKDYAVEAARLIKSKNPHNMVEVKDLQRGDVTAVALRPV
jgi:hypothetical protein